MRRPYDPIAEFAWLRADWTGTSSHEHSNQFCRCLFVGMDASSRHERASIRGSLEGSMPVQALELQLPARRYKGAPPMMTTAGDQIEYLPLFR
jgi:hypothetical protein